MKRLLCGSVVLAASLGLVSCNGDPTSEFRNGPTQILANPSTVFINQSDEEPVNIRVVDEAGDPLVATWELSETGPGITVERNPDFLPTTAGAPLESEVQFIVTAGGSPTASAFTVTAGDLSLEIPVNVMPTELPTATFSNTTPALNEPVTLTVEGFSFLPDAAVIIGTDSAIVTSNTGESLTFVPIPGSTGIPTIGNIAVNFQPGIPLTLPTTAEFTAAPVANVPGSEDPGTAPSLVTPAAGERSAFFDLPDFTASDTHFFELTVTEAGTFTITMDWNIGDDVDMVVCNADFSSCDGQAATGNHPEIGEYDLAPGTYFVVAVDFGQDAEFCPGCVPAIGSELEILVENAGATTGELRKFPSTPRSLKSSWPLERKARK